jgi:hypothetical protein
MTDDEVIDAYHRALSSYGSAKAGRGDRVAAFVELLACERAFSSRFGLESKLQHYRDCYWP